MLALTGTLGTEVHDDRHRHTLRRWLAHGDVGEDLGLDRLVHDGIPCGFGKGELGNMPRFVHPDAYLHIHHGTACLFIGAQSIDDAVLQLPCVVAKLAAATAASPPKPPPLPLPPEASPDAS